MYTRKKVYKKIQLFFTYPSHPHFYPSSSSSILLFSLLHLLNFIIFPPPPHFFPSSLPLHTFFPSPRGLLIVIVIPPPPHFFLNFTFPHVLLFSFLLPDGMKYSGGKIKNSCGAEGKTIKMRRRRRRKENKKNRGSGGGKIIKLKRRGRRKQKKKMRRWRMGNKKNEEEEGK